MNTEPRYEKRTYALDYTLTSGETGHREIDVAVNIDASPDSVSRARAHCDRHGYVYAVGVYVAVMRMACTALQHRDVVSFSITRTDAPEEFPAMAAPFRDGAVAEWVDAEGTHNRRELAVELDSNYAQSPYFVTVGHRTYEAASPYVAAYTAACELLYRLPVEAFTVARA